MPTYPRTAPGPFRADQIRDGDEFELSDGHAVRCLPSGSRHGNAQLDGGRVLASDPAVRGRAGIDIGIAWNDDKNLRAPDLVVGHSERAPGWLRSVPPLAVEYADTGQDEAELAAKISELHAAGTKYIWVVRLTGPLRVDVHTRGEPIRTVGADGELLAPGVLQNPVPVRALVDANAADAASLRNLLQAHGYTSIEEIQAEALARAILTVLATRGISVDDEQAGRIRGCRDMPTFARWLRLAVTASSVGELD
jgi:hypothetical protein